MLKTGSFHFFVHSKWFKIVLDKHIFGPKTTIFQGMLAFLGGPKWATTSSKRAKNTCFGIPCGVGSFVKRFFFLHPVDLVDPFWHPPLGASSCSLL